MNSRKRSRADPAGGAPSGTIDGRVSGGAATGGAAAGDVPSVAQQKAARQEGLLARLQALAAELRKPGTISGPPSLAEAKADLLVSIVQMAPPGQRAGAIIDDGQVLAAAKEGTLEAAAGLYELALAAYTFKGKKAAKNYKEMLEKMLSTANAFAHMGVGANGRATVGSAAASAALPALGPAGAAQEGLKRMAPGARVTDKVRTYMMMVYQSADGIWPGEAQVTLHVAPVGRSGQKTVYVETVIQGVGAGVVWGPSAQEGAMARGWMMDDGMVPETLMRERTNVERGRLYGTKTLDAAAEESRAVAEKGAEESARLAAEARAERNAHEEAQREANRVREAKRAEKRAEKREKIAAALEVERQARERESSVQHVLEAQAEEQLLEADELPPADEAAARQRAIQSRLINLLAAFQDGQKLAAAEDKSVQAAAAHVQSAPEEQRELAELRAQLAEIEKEARLNQIFGNEWEKIGRHRVAGEHDLGSEDGVAVTVTIVAASTEPRELQHLSDLQHSSSASNFDANGLTDASAARIARLRELAPQAGVFAYRSGGSLTSSWIAVREHDLMGVAGTWDEVSQQLPALCRSVCVSHATLWATFRGATHEGAAVSSLLAYMALFKGTMEIDHVVSVGAMTTMLRAALDVVASAPSCPTYTADDIADVFQQVFRLTNHIECMEKVQYVVNSVRADWTRSVVTLQRPFSHRLLEADLIDENGIPFSRMPFCHQRESIAAALSEHEQLQARMQHDVAARYVVMCRLLLLRVQSETPRSFVFYVLAAMLAQCVEATKLWLA